MTQLNIEKYQCANCCAKHINTLPSISSGECHLLDDLDKVFGNELKYIKSSFDGLNLAICEFCNAAFHKLTASRNEFFGRTGTSSWINGIVNSSEQLTISHISEDNNQIPSSEIEDEESERILPSQMIIETQNSNPRMDVSNEMLEAENIEYEEKCLKLIIKKVAQLNVVYVPFSLRNHFSCPHCERKFYTTELKECHIKSVHQLPNTKSFLCQLCNKIFIHKWFYTNHLKVIHSGIELEFTCTICNEKYKNKNDLNLHTKLVHSKLPFTCNHCDASFGTIGTLDGIHPLRNHLMEFHSDSWEAKAAKFNSDQEKQEGNDSKLKQCPSCRMTFTNRRILNCHALFEHHNRNVCEVCKEEFSSSEEMSAHFHKTGHSLKTCNKCPTSKTWPLMHMLIRHMDSVHATKQNNNYSLHCEICGGGFRTYFHLSLHYKLHIKKTVKNHICDQCGRSFLYQYDLKRHFQSVHGRESSNINNPSSQTITSTSSFKCKICNMIFDSKKKLLLHCRATLSHGGKPIQSNGSHRLKRDFTEEELQYVFLNNDVPLRKYECKVCNKGFRDSNKCFRHLCNLHSIYFRGFQDSPKKDECPICSKTVQRLSEHMIIHTKASTWSSTQSMKCNLCSYVVFGDILLMREHWIKCHPETTEAKSASNNNQRRKEELYSLTEKVYGKENECSSCKLLFNSIIEKEKHVEIFHKFVVSCHFCFTTFKTESACRKHEKEFHSLYPCKHCSTVSVSAEDFHNHFTEEHLKLPYICELCGQQYINNSIPYVHYANHFGIKKSKERSKSVSKLKTSDMKAYRKDYKQSSMCHLCGVKFPGRRTSLLEDHFAKIHKVYASWECESCGHLFLEISTLRSHMKKAHKIYDYVLDISKYGGKNETLKARHYSVADKKYKCPHCDALMLKSNSYNQHISSKHPRNGNSSNITAKSKSRNLPKRKCTKKRKWKEDSDSTDANEDSDTSLSDSD